MLNNAETKDYAQRASDHLEAASSERTREGKREHLDKAAMYAALDEEARRLYYAVS